MRKIGLFIVALFFIAGIAHADTLFDPCQQFPKQSVAINISSATDTQMVAAVTGAAVYVCGFGLNQVAGVGSVQFEYGTGAACATGLTALSGVLYGGTVTNTVTNLTRNGASTTFVTPTSAALCIKSTGTVQQSGYISYVQTNTPTVANTSDPCRFGPKKSAAINIATATDTQLVALTAGVPIYVCGWVLNQVNGTGTLGFEYGTGTNCGTGKNALTGVYTAAAVANGTTNQYNPPETTDLVVPAGNALCAVSTGTIQQSGWVTYADLSASAGMDPCTQHPRLNAAINVSSGTTTLFVTGATGHRIHVCGMYFQSADGAGPSTMTFEYGTGATCGTGTTVLTGPLSGGLTAGANTLTINTDNAENRYAQFVVPDGNNLCGLSTTSITQTGWLNYVFD